MGDEGRPAVEAELRERVKELSCLYAIAQVAGRVGASLDDILASVVRILPSAWQYPAVAYARITVSEATHVTPGFRESPWRQVSDIVVAGKTIGTVEMFYIEASPDCNEGPFLKEERALIEAVARQVGMVVERHRTEAAHLRLAAQVRHADRLATIGQLTAGVAHEINEPLGTILGFAQLLQKSPSLSDRDRADVDKITAASLFAREIIRKLLTFSRQMPTIRRPVDLNRLIQDGMQFLAVRCEKQGIDLVLQPSPRSPMVSGDPGQLNQVLVNLAVNAMQAMPDGGRLDIAVQADGGRARLVVEDTGVGMDENVLGNIFVPFFTTKDVGEGTGLGLPVVHGIVTAHGGSIDVLSAPHKGTRFTISLPLGDRGMEEQARG